MTTEGEHIGNCLFAGLAVYQDLKENLLFCSNRSLESSKITKTDTPKVTSHVIPPFVDMNVVLYSFPNYASVSVSLMFALSTCTGVAINPCEYEAYCSGNSLNVLVCKKYLNSLRTGNVQFIRKVLKIKWFQSLHKLSYITVNALLLEQKASSCIQIYASSFVKARKDNIFQDIYHRYFLRDACVLAIFPTTDSHKAQLEDWTSYASFVGKINKLERLKFSGLGRIMVNYIYGLQKNEKNTEIIIKEKDFNTKYDISLRYDIKFNIVLISGNHNGKDTELNLMFQGGSDSAVLVTLIVDYLQVSKELGFVPNLTSWQMFNIVSANFIVPLLNVHTKGKTEQLLNILNKFNSVAYGYSLHLEMKGNSFYSFEQNATLAKLTIETAFCIPECRVSKSRKMLYSKECHYLLISDITNNTNGSFAKIYGNRCASVNQITLDWSMGLHVANLLTSRNLEILLPGIYEKAEIHIVNRNSSEEKNEDHFTIRWLNRRITQRVNTSLLLNGKRYLIFPENMKKMKVYSWQEAEELCIKFKSHLPIFRSLSDVQDMIDIILRAAWTGPIRMIFIGLQVS